MNGQNSNIREEKVIRLLKWLTDGYIYKHEVGWAHMENIWDLNKRAPLRIHGSEWTIDTKDTKTLLNAISDFPHLEKDTDLQAQ